MCKDDDRKIIKIRMPIDVKYLFKKFNELDQFIPVDFDDEGCIPDFIKFDRNDKDLYSTIEEILTVYVNHKSNKLNDSENINKCYYINFSEKLFKEGMINKCTFDIVEWFDDYINDNVEIKALYTELSKSLFKSKEKYIDYLNNGENIENIDSIHLSRINCIENFNLVMKRVILDNFNNEIDTLTEHMVENIVEDSNYNKVKSSILEAIGYFKIIGIGFINENVNIIMDNLISEIREEHYKACFVSQYF